MKRFLELSGRLSLLQKAWLLAPVAVWWSYQPLLSFGQNGTMYFELSLTLLYVVALALMGVPSVWRAQAALLKSRVVWLASCFVLISFASLAWTPNGLRGVLTAGVLAALWLVFLAAVAQKKQLGAIAWALARLFIISAVAMSVLALVQFVAGIWLERELTLLCAGCAAEQFGFVRPNVLTIEPQFFGSLLLAPLLITLHHLLKQPRNWWLMAALFIMSTALFLTLSRGAIFAAGVGVLILFGLAWRQARPHRIVLPGALLLAGALACLLLQGAAAAISPRVNETFMGAVRSSVHQLTLGVVALPDDEQPLPPSEAAEPKFDGYVAESTTTRTERSRVALLTWADNPLRILGGVGLGGAGVAMHTAFPTQIGAREIVQNQYVETLLETGVVGLLAFAAWLGGLLYLTRQVRWLWAIIAAFALQWLFFSGYPNALHIYLVFIVMAATAAFSVRHAR